MAERAGCGQFGKEAMYLQIRPLSEMEMVGRTVQVSDNVFIDLDANGEPVGVELLGGVSLVDVLFQVIEKASWGGASG